MEYCIITPGSEDGKSSLLNSCFFVRDPQCIRYTPSICRICLIAVAYMADLDDLITAAHVTGGVLKQPLLLVRFHQSEQLARLFVVVVVIFAEVPPFDVAAHLLQRFVMLRLLLPHPVAVGLIMEGSTLVAIDAHLSVAVKGVVLLFSAPGLIHRYLMMVHTQAVALRITVGEETALQHPVG